MFQVIQISTHSEHAQQYSWGQNISAVCLMIQLYKQDIAYNKWEHQLDATIKYIFHLKLVSICFGRDIAHHQEITQLYIPAYGNRPCNEEKLT